MIKPRTDWLELARSIKGVDLVERCARELCHVRHGEDRYPRLSVGEQGWWYQRAQRTLRQYGIAAPNRPAILKD
jgi:hypothetical protein